MEKALSELLKEFQRKLKRKSKSPTDKLVLAWEKILGDKVAAQTRLLGIKQQILTVRVDSAALCQELNNFRKPKLYKALAATDIGKRIRDIKFIL
jgi:hypothetical protein